MSINIPSQGSTGIYSKVQKEEKKIVNKPAQILRPRQKPEWIEMYSSDEDIFAEKEPEEKKELLTEFVTESSIEKKEEKIAEINERSGKIESKGNIKLDSKQKIIPKNQNNKNTYENTNETLTKDIVEPNINVKPKRKIHISVVVDDNIKKQENDNKDKNNATALITTNKIEDILKRKIFENVDNDDDEIYKDLINTENLKKKLIEEENKKKTEEKKKQNAKLEEAKNDSADDDIFANAGDDLKIDINKKIIEKYQNKLEEKKLKESLEEIGGSNLIDSSHNKLRDIEKKKKLEKKYSSKLNTNEDSDRSIEYSSEDDLFRPMFKEKESRETIKEQMNREAQEANIQEIEEKLKAQKKQETKKLVIKYIKEDINKKTVYDADEDLELPNDDDDPDDLEEYEQWKIREFKRIKKQAEEDELKFKEKLEIERRRNLTDEQRKEENLRLGSDETLRPFKSKLKYLQKYYHKGAFFSNERQENMEHVLNRDYNLPTWEDKIDRSNLPKILQKRRGLQFKKGQTKYTHLTAEDTTNFDPNFKVPENIHNKVIGNMGGLKGKDKFEINNDYNRKYKK